MNEGSYSLLEITLTGHQKHTHQYDNPKSEKNVKTN